MRDIEQDRKRLETAICYSDDGDWARSALRDYMDECERLRAEVERLRQGSEQSPNWGGRPE